MKHSFFRRPLGKIFIVLGVLFALWSALWFALSSYANGQVQSVIDSMAKNGVVANCSDRKVVGFPFHLALSCGQTDVETKSNGLRMDVGSVLAGTKLYSPDKLSLELGSPFTTAPSGVPIKADWQNLHLAADVTMQGGFDRIDFNLSKFKAQVQENKFLVEDGSVALIAGLEATQGDLHVESDLSGIAANTATLKLPEFRLRSNGRMIDGYDDLIVQKTALNDALRDGAEFDVGLLQLSVSGDGELAFSGPLELHEDGTLSGKIRIGVENPDAVADWAEKISPQLKQAVLILTQAVNGMGKKQKFGDQELSSIFVTLTRGTMKLGFIQLAKIPPLKLN